MIGVSKLLMGAASESDGLRYRTEDKDGPKQIKYDKTVKRTNIADRPTDLQTDDLIPAPREPSVFCNKLFLNAGQSCRITTLSTYQSNAFTK